MHKHIGTALTVSAALVAVGVTAPAATAAPKLPTGCAFNGATGLTTCTTTSVETTRTEAAAYERFRDDSSLFFVLCQSMVPDTVIALTRPGVTTTAVAQTTTVTTTSYRGAATGKGNKPISTTNQIVKTVSLPSDQEGTVGCYGTPSDGADFYFTSGTVYPGYSIVVG